jgi:hypothetical protein
VQLWPLIAQRFVAGRGYVSEPGSTGGPGDRVATTARNRPAPRCAARPPNGSGWRSSRRVSPDATATSNRSTAAFATNTPTSAPSGPVPTVGSSSATGRTSTAVTAGIPHSATRPEPDMLRPAPTGNRLVQVLGQCAGSGQSVLGGKWISGLQAQGGSHGETLFRDVAGRRVPR